MLSNAMLMSWWMCPLAVGCLFPIKLQSLNWITGVSVVGWPNRCNTGGCLGDFRDSLPCEHLVPSPLKALLNMAETHLSHIAIAKWEGSHVAREGNQSLYMLFVPVCVCVCVVWVTVYHWLSNGFTQLILPIKCDVKLACISGIHFRNVWTTDVW